MMELGFQQFALTKERTIPAREWRQVDVADRYLSAPPSVPLIRILSGDRQIAWLLGWAADEQLGYLGDGAVQLAPGQCLDKFRETLCGRFVVVGQDVDGTVSIRTDAAGLFPVVFDAEQQIVASSPAVIGCYGGLRRDDAVIGNVRRMDGTTWYPFGLTPYAGIRRLLPSQILRIKRDEFDISESSPLTKTENLSVTASEIFLQVASYVKSFSSQGPLTAHLTGGFDSRMVMAATMKAGVKARYVTIRCRGAELDIHIARRLAKMSGARYETIPYIAPTAMELAEWHGRVGNCVDDAVAQLCATVRKFDDRAVTLTGVCGEVARAFYWTKHDLGAADINSSVLLRRLGFVETTLLEGEAVRWLGNFHAGERNTTILDNAYIDLRGACWAGPSMPGHLVPKPTISPFNSVSVYRAMLTMDEKYRFSQRFAMDFIGAAFPHLLSERFNAASGLWRLRFLKQEAKTLLPRSAKLAIKRLIRA